MPQSTHRQSLSRIWKMPIILFVEPISIGPTKLHWKSPPFWSSIAKIICRFHISPSTSIASTGISKLYPSVLRLLNSAAIQAPSWIKGSRSVFDFLTSMFANMGRKFTKLSVWLMLGRVPSQNTPLERVLRLIPERWRPMAASMRLSRSLKSDSACVGQRELGLISTVVLEQGMIRWE